MGLQFEHREYIWILGGIVLLAGLFFFLLRWKARVRKRMGDEKLVKALVGNYAPGFFIIKFILVIIAFGAGVLAVMNLRRPAADETSSRKGIDVVVALDVSKSMLATDLVPNRLERAKQLITKLMDAMPDDRIGLVVFAGRAYLQMPLTTDYGAAQLYISSAAPEMVPYQGTVISEALKQSSNAFNTTERRFKTVVLISDGEDHDVTAITTAKELATEGMMINTIGIGSPEGSYIPDSATGENKKDGFGNDVISRLNEDVLKQVAASTNGIYIRLQDSDDAVRQLQQQFSGIETKAYGDLSLMNFQSFYWWFAGAMFLLLLVEYFIPETRKRPSTSSEKASLTNSGKKKPALAVLVTLLGLFGQAQETEKIIQKGNDLYRAKDYEKAETAYNEALAKEKGNTTATFNRGNTLYRQSKAEDAIKVMDEVVMNTNEAALKGKAFYNKGVVLSGQQRLEESIDAYKNALRQNPDDQEARENLQKALLELKKKTPPPPKQNKNQNQNKKPQPQQPKMNQKEAEQRLKLLEQKEKEVQQRMQNEKAKNGVPQPKDW